MNTQIAEVVDNGSSSSVDFYMDIMCGPADQIKYTKCLY